MRTVLGKIVGLAGAAEVVDAQGQHRLLHTGDAVHAGDQLLTAAGVQIGMPDANGQVMMFAGEQTIRMSEVLVAAETLMDISEHAVDPAVVQHVLAALQVDDVLLQLSAPLASLELASLQQQGAAFISIAHTPLTEQLSPEMSQRDALHIQDVLTAGESDAGLATSGLSITQMADLVTQTSLSADMALPESTLNDLMKD